MTEEQLKAMNKKLNKIRTLKKPIYTEVGSLGMTVCYRYRCKEFIYAYEPYFNCMVIVASVSDKNKIVRPAHGYFKNHYHGYTTENYAKRIGYSFNNN